MTGVMVVREQGEFSIAGFDYTRNWQLRVVKDFGSWASFGLSIENPAELVYNGTGAVANGGNVGGWLVNWANPGSTFLGDVFGEGQLHRTADDVSSRGFGYDCVWRWR